MVAEFAERLRTQVREFVVLPVAPDVLHRIQLRRVAGQRLQRDAAALGPHVLLDDATAVRGEPVPDHEELAAQMAPQVAEEVDDLRPFDRSREEPEVETPPRDARDRREQVPVEVVLEDWCLPTRGPRATAVWSFRQPALVDEDDRLPLRGSVFFSVGQRARFQRRIAASSRSSARPVGRWQLQPSCLRSRQT
jgi:hypothetical protein